MLEIRKAGRYSKNANFSDNTLIDLYQNKGMSMHAVAKELKVSSGTVWRRLHKIAKKQKEQASQNNEKTED